MKKNIIGIVLCLATTLGASAQKPGWQWAQIGNDGDFGWATDVVVDVSGNVYVTGTFTNVLTIGATTLTSTGNTDMFVAKYDASGQFIWARSAGGKGEDQSFGIANDKMGNVYVGGMFSDTAFYDAMTFISKGWSDLSLAKYDSNGNSIWIKAWGSIYTERGSKLFVDEESNLYLTGNFAANGGSTTYETIDFDGIILTSKGDGDVFIIKLDTTGAFKWAKNAGGKFPDFAGDINVDVTSNVFVTGSSGSSKMIFDNDTLSNKKMFVAKYDSSGNALWVRGASTTYAVYGTSIATDKYGNVYAGGYSNEDQAFDFGSVILNNNDQAYIAKYNPSGSLLWAKNISTYCFYDAVSDMVIDNDNNIFLAGQFNYLGVFGSDTLHSSGYDDVSVIKLDSNGNHIWAVQAGGGSNDGGYGIALDNNGNIVVAGYVSSAPAYFGSHTVSAVGYWDMFVAKLSATTGLPVLPADDKSIRVYPNPAPGIFTVQFEKGFSELRVYDMQGRVVEKRELYPDQKEIRLDGNKWAEGIYRLLLSGKNGIVSAKLIIQKP